MEFAIYYIPKEEDIYALGSSVLGYDIRQQKSVPFAEGIEADWVRNISQYGFHATITDAVTITPKALPNVEEKLKTLLGCFPKDFAFMLTQESRGVSFWENNPTMAALKFVPNDAVIMLHTLLVAQLQTLGSDSLYLKSLAESGVPANWGEDKVAKTKLFYSPYILDEFVPHFSLINPYDGDKKAEIEAKLSNMFRPFFEITMESLCIVTRDTAEEAFRIYRELPLH